MDNTIDSELAWAIGLFEGEGSLGVFGNGKCSRTGRARKSFSIQIVMGDEQPIRKFASILKEHGFFGVVDGPIKFKGSKLDFYRWRARGPGEEKMRLLDVFSTMLSPRRNLKVDEVREYVKTLPDRRAERGKAIVCANNRRGKRIPTKKVGQ